MRIVASTLIITLSFLNFDALCWAQNTNNSKDAKALNKIINNLPNDEATKDNPTKDKEKKDNAQRANYAIVQALNKTTGKTSVLELKVGENTPFGLINIIPHRCLQSPLDQKPENKILLEIIENKNEGGEKISQKRIFYGWMFSSSPSVSGLEHPIYDIIAINCKNK